MSSVRAGVGRIVRLVGHIECFRRSRRGGLATVGDSITVGRGDPRLGILADDSWVSYVVRDRRIAYGYNAAVSGQTTAELVDRLPGVLRRRPAVVVVATGTNDSSPSETTDLVREAIARIRAAGAEPVIATIPPLASRAGFVADLNGRIRGLAAECSVRLVDFHRVLADGDDFRPGLSDDDRHPNAAGSQLMARAAAPVLIEAFAAR